MPSTTTAIDWPRAVDAGPVRGEHFTRIYELKRPVQGALRVAVVHVTIPPAPGEYGQPIATNTWLRSVDEDGELDEFLSVSAEVWARIGVAYRPPSEFGPGFALDYVHPLTVLASLGFFVVEPALKDGPR